MALLELFDETLDINSTENYQLSVQLCTDGLTFCLLDSIRNKYILLRSYTPENARKFNSDQLEEILTKDDFLKRKYSKTHILLTSSKSTIVPSALYDPAKKEEYFTFNHVAAESNIILTNKLPEPDSYLLFAISKPVSEIISKYFSQSAPVHHLKPLFNLIAHSGITEGEHSIHAHIESDFFNLLIFNNHSLQLCNTFPYRNLSDILYHILNVFKSMNIRQEETIYLTGQTERYDDLFSNLSLYIRGVKFAEPAGNFTFSYVFNETSLHRYINLFTLISCES
jgi:hypothetical protein